MYKYVIVSHLIIFSLFFSLKELEAAPFCHQSIALDTWMVTGSLNGYPGSAGVRDSAIVGNDEILVGRFTRTYPAGQGEKTGFNRVGFLVLDRYSGAPSVHDFDPEVNGSIEAVSCDGYDCIVAGGFNQFRGVPVNQIAKFNVLTGVVDQSFKVHSLHQGSYHSLLYRNGLVYAGGSFTGFVDSQGTVTHRLYLAAFNSIGQLTSWTPTADQEVFRLRMSPSGNIFVAGDFNSISGSPRQGFAEITPTGIITNFNPSPSPNDTGVIGRDIAFYNKNIILTGNFDKMAGNIHYGLAMVDSHGVDTGWNPLTNFGFTGTALAVTSNSLYVGFSSFDGLIGGQSRKRFAELDLRTGYATTFQTDVDVLESADFPAGIYNIHITDRVDVRSCRQLYITGNFNTVKMRGFLNNSSIRVY